MYPCPLMRYTSAASPTRATRSHERRQERTHTRRRTRWHAADTVATFVATWLGWRALIDLLDLLRTLPDSNDDFGLF